MAEGQGLFNGRPVAPRGRRMIEIAPQGILNLWSDGTETTVVAPEETRPGMEFSNGDFLHGRLLGIDTERQELWSVEGASGPLIFPVAQMRRINFDAEQAGGSPPHSLVKFLGGDWLAADVAGVQGDTLRLTLGPGTEIAVPRAQVEWIYYSKGALGECYDGPFSAEGWESEDNWKYEDGALRAETPSMIWRNFDALPDQVEYLVELNQTKGDPDFAITVQGQVLGPRSISGGIRLVVQYNRLALVAQTGSGMQSESASLEGILPPPGAHGLRLDAPLRMRIFEDCVAGRIAIFVENRKVGEWQIARLPAGSNRGAFSFQPLTWKAGTELSIPRFRVMPWDGHLPVSGDAGERPESKDRLGLVGGATYYGDLVGAGQNHVKLSTIDGLVNIPCAPGALLRLSRTGKHPADFPGAARVRLSRGGEFNVRSIASADGASTTVRTAFCERLDVLMALLKELHSPTPPGSPRTRIALSSRMETSFAGCSTRWIKKAPSSGKRARPRRQWRSLFPGCSGWRGGAP